MMVTMHDLLAVLSEHVGRERGASVEYLASKLDTTERRVRQLVSELRLEGFAVAAHPSCGYFICETADELELCCQFLRSRAMHSLTLESRLRKCSLGDLLGQLHLKT